MISISALFVSVLCVVVSLAIYKWNEREDIRFKIEMMRSNQYSWEEFDMVNKEKFESDYWRTTEDGESTTTTG